MLKNQHTYNEFLDKLNAALDNISEGIDYDEPPNKINPDDIMINYDNYCTFMYYSNDVHAYGFPKGKPDYNTFGVNRNTYTHIKLYIDVLKNDKHFFDEALLESGAMSDSELKEMHTDYEGYPTELNSIASDIAQSIAPSKAGKDFVEGRVSDNQEIVSFWKEPPDQKLLKCIKWLLKENLINDDTWIVSENFDAFKPGDNARMRKIDPERQAEYDLRRQLHLLPPDQKRAAMKKLGLAWNSSKSPWQKEAERLGFAKPGQKWWAIRSESK